ncbi:MAG: hypothetical protein C0440_05840 [Candidatus Pelagibacter sp.]|nr:hypothetical protein [Candidatus Pelagibacter sp.]
MKVKEEWLYCYRAVDKEGQTIDFFLSKIRESKAAFYFAQKASYSKEELAEYDGYWDLISIEKTIKADTEQKGKSEGLIEGEQIGIEKGEQKTKREIALEMLRDVAPDQSIIKYAKITQIELNDIKG